MMPSDDNAPAKLYRETCARLPTVDLELRRTIAAGPGDLDTHDRQLEEIAALRLTELVPPAVATEPSDLVRVLFWNAERGRHLGGVAALLAGQGAGVNLLCELDHGMARSSQRHTARDLAERLGQGYAFAVEFLELGLGDRNERARHAGADNAQGFHGSAIVSPHALRDPLLIRLERDGHWFDGGRGERRVGGRIAQAATLSVGGTDVVFAVVHFESHSDPDHRASQMRTLLLALDDYAPGTPAIIGGDFNTATAPREVLKRPGAREELLEEDPDRLLHPMPHEPLFAIAREAGYDWTGCNDGRPTQRLRPDQPRRPLGRIDWFFARFLSVSDPATIPAVDAGGGTISDHDALVVTVRPEA